MQIYSVTKALKIPYISIKWENLEDEYELDYKLYQALNSQIPPSHRINIHPPANKLMKGIIDLINYYKWEYVTILYQESNGLNRIEDLIKLTRKLGSGNQGLNMIGNTSPKIRVQVRQLSSDINKWIYLIKDVKLSGSSHIIVDIQTKYLNKFLEQVEFKKNLIKSKIFALKVIYINIFHNRPNKLD